MTPYLLDNTHTIVLDFRKGVMYNVSMMGITKETKMSDYSLYVQTASAISDKAIQAEFIAHVTAFRQIKQRVPNATEQVALLEAAKEAQ